MYFDQDMNLITSGFKQITTAAQGMKEHVQMEPVVLDQNGYVMVYVSNESDELNWVHFDDFAVTHSKTPIVQADDYYPFGLTFNSFTRSYSEPQKNLYQGKELQEELATYDFHARMYDPVLGRTFQQDPMGEMFYDHSPYSWVKNNPLLRIDPTGMTDFKFDKKSGEVTQVGKKNDKPDQIVKTNNKGEVKYKKNGDPRVVIGGIEKGILEGGQNWKTDDQVIAVGGEGQASLAGVEDFVTRFSEHVGVEIAGAYLSQEDRADATITKVYIDEYEGNGTRDSGSTLTGLGRLPSGQLVNPSLEGFNTITDFHTHLTTLSGVLRDAIERPSGISDSGGGDLQYRDNQRAHFYNFVILTRTATYPTEVQKIPYTNWKK